MAKENKINKRDISAPEFLVTTGRNHYRSLVQAQTNKDLYDAMDDGALEMLAYLYSQFRCKDLSEKERRESIKLYFQLLKEFGGTPAARQSMKISTDENVDVRKDADLMEMIDG